MDANGEWTCPAGNVSGRDPAMPSSVTKGTKKLDANRRVGYPTKYC